MLKNQDNQWQEMGMFTEDTTIPGPNFPYVLFDKKRLRDFLNMSDLHVLILYNEFINIATDAMKNLETSGKHHVASGVVEMIIGELGDIWITDIKTSKPYHEMALVAGYPELYFEILKTNMMYAKSLSGF